MKKRIATFTLIILTAVMLIFALGSCVVEEKTPEEQAMETLTLIDDKMNSLSAYRMQGTSTVRIFSNSKYMEGVQNTTLIYSGVGTDDFAAFMTTTMDTYEVGSEDKNTICVNEGFYDGQMYHEVAFESGAKNRLKSTITAEEYLSYSNSHDSFLPVQIQEIEESTELQRTAQNDGGWLVVLKANGVSARRLAEELIGASSMYMIYELASVTGATMTVEADAEYRAERITVSFDFIGNNGEVADDDLMPYFFAEIDVDHYDVTKNFDVDLTEYTQVDDLRAIKTIESAVNNTYALKGGSVELVQNYYTKTGNKFLLTQLTGVTYSVDESYKLSFNMESSVNDQKTVITYEKGWMYTDGERENINNLTALKNIVACFDPYSFSRLYLTDVQTIDATNVVYKFTKSGKEITVTIKDGLISKIEYSANVIISGVDCTVKTVSTITPTAAPV